MNHTPANTARRFPTTPRIESTATAVTAGSVTAQRIDDFIKRKLNEANSDGGYGISDSAARAARLGFVNAANVRYSAFLEAFRSSPHLTSTYSEKYPNSLFLPWPALHAVIKALDLWVDLPEHYMGAVPSEQLPWMEVFDLDPIDTIVAEDLDGLLPGLDAERSEVVQLAIKQVFQSGVDHQHMPMSAWSSTHEVQRVVIQAGRLARPVYELWRQVCNSFFVAAPKEAFSTTEDFLSRLRRLATDTATESTIAPDDPLVVHFCRGGCLVVAAWGEEASALNKLTRSLGI